MSIASDLTAVATNLNSALDEINDKIEAKGGTASETVYGVAAAVENLPSGGENMISYAESSNRPYIQTETGEYIDTYRSDVYCHYSLCKSDKNNFIFKPQDATSNWRIIYRFKANSSQSNSYSYIYANSSGAEDTGGYAGIRTADWKLYLSSGARGDSVYFDTTIVPDTWYYVVSYVDVPSLTNILSLYDDDGKLIEAFSRKISILANTSYFACVGGGKSLYYLIKGYTDISSICYEIDGVPVWGKTNSKTENMGILHDDDIYQEVEYIESTGTQYINTRYILSESGLSRFYIECEQSNQLQLNSTVFGTFMQLDENPMVALDIFPNSPVFTGLKYDETPSNFGIIDATSFYGNKHTVDLTLSQSSYTLIVDGVTSSGQFQRGDLSIFTYPLFLFARSSNITPISNYAQIKIGRFKLYDSTGNIRRDFVPVYNIYTGKAGMYDTVEGKFYGNNGSGTFLKGADVNA